MNGTEHRTTTYLTSFEADFDFEHIPVDASIKLNNDLMDALEPFPYEKCVAFNPAYMAGFLAEQADTEKEDMADRLERRLQTDLKDYIRRDLKQYYDCTSVSENPKVFDLTYGNYQTEYVMLPVWVLNIKYKNLRYKIAINGHTGEVVGKIPISKAKVALNWATAFGLCTLVCTIITQLLFGGVSLW